jgi:hypothetical protein
VAEPAAPRSATLAAWTRSWRAGLVSVDQVVDEVCRTDAEHIFDGLPDRARPASLTEGLAMFSRLGPDQIRLALPTPGDPRGLPGPGPFTSAALTAGEGVLCGLVGLVPEVDVRRSGSGDAWRVVVWRCLPFSSGDGGLALSGRDPLAIADAGALTVGEAEHDLLMALRESTDLLRRLDVARWRPELAAALAELRHDTEGGLPPGYDARCRRLVARAGTVAGILSLATADAPGGAVTAFEAAERDAALRPLATAARRAHTAAINAPLR